MIQAVGTEYIKNMVAGNSMKMHLNRCALHYQLNHNCINNQIFIFLVLEY